MKMVNLDIFLSLPAGTVYRKYNRNYELHADLCIKGETCSGGRDFFVQDLTSPQTGDDPTHYATFEAFDKGADMRIDYDLEGRNGQSEPEQMFAVYDRQDVNALCERLLQAQLDARSN